MLVIVYTGIKGTQTCCISRNVLKNQPKCHSVLLADYGFQSRKFLSTLEGRWG